MTPDYPTIVPPDNLRLPDALTIKYGPAPLLARFILEGDKAARRIGLRLRVRNDFDALAALNEREVAKGTWLQLVEAYDPRRNDLTPENAFWVSGENEDGEIVVTWAARIYNWIGTSLAEQNLAVWCWENMGDSISMPPAASLITGLCVCGGAAWVRPGFRGMHLSHLFPRVGKAYACARWPIDWAIGFIGSANAARGLALSFGQKHVSCSDKFVLTYTPVAAVYDDLANFLRSEVFGAEPAGTAALLDGNTLQHIVTKTSPDGVFQGSISRS